jgi:hypothetical protein
MATPTPGTTSPPPSPLPGTKPLTAETLRLLQWVSLRHLDVALILYLASVSLVVGTAWFVGGPPLGRPFDPVAGIVAGLAMGITGLAGLPFGIRWSVQRWQRKGWVVGYFDNTAAQLVHPTPEGAWQLSDHHALHRGHRLAGPFRQRVFQHLAAEADRLQVVIITDTRVRKLADLHIADMPGLTLVNDTRRDMIRRHIYELRREPGPTIAP